MVSFFLVEINLPTPKNGRVCVNLLDLFPITHCILLVW